MKLFVSGRKNVFETLKNSFSKENKVIWIHAASLGEYEQGVPIMEELRKTYPHHQLLVTFFSPSGYEIKKNNKFATVTTYLPLDTKKNAQKFVDLVSPELAIFIKYEVWPNYLFELKKEAIPAILISGVFREEQIFFKSYGSFMKNALFSFDHLFVQEKKSEEILRAHGFTRVSISGDTRFDRVSNQLKINNTLDFIAEFKDNHLCVVCGSTWPEDEAALEKYINYANKGVKFIIAPHQINASKIKELRNRLHKETVLFSEKENQPLKDYDVLIIDTIGLLTKIYSYADIAYVGGAMGQTGLHNILEPATFGVPIVIGQHHEKFPEAKQLQDLGGLFSVKNSVELQEVLDDLVLKKDFREKSGNLSKGFIESHTGATPLIFGFIESKYLAEGLKNS